MTRIKISNRKNRSGPPATPRKERLAWRAGFSLVEMLIYSAIMALFLVVSINASIIMLGAYSKARTAKLLNTAAVETLSKIRTEVQKSFNVDSAGSILGANPGKLTIDQNIVGGSEKVEFSVATSTLVMRRGGILVGAITPQNISVDNIIFYKVTSGSNQAVRSVLTLTASRGGESKTETFYLTTALRAAY